MSEIKFIKFWAAWCAPCVQLAPIVDAISKDYQDIEFISIDVDKDTEMAKKYGVRSIPVVFIEKDGKEIAKFVGMKSEEDIRQLLDDSKK